MSSNMQEIVRMFNKMNWQIPVFGAILLNKAMDKVLLTQTFIANNKGGAWMFPRGKVEKKDHGNSFDCACREVRLGGHGSTSETSTARCTEAAGVTSIAS